MVIEQDLDQAQKGAVLHQDLIWTNITFPVPLFRKVGTFNFNLAKMYTLCTGLGTGSLGPHAPQLLIERLDNNHIFLMHAYSSVSKNQFIVLICNCAQCEFLLIHLVGKSGDLSAEILA